MSVTGSAPSPQFSPRKLRVVMAQLDFLVGDIPGNTELVIDAARRASTEHQADVVVFPELCLTGYPPEDLLLRPSLEIRVLEALERLQQENLGPAIVIGAPLREGALLYNAAVVIEAGQETGRYFKRFPPNYQVFDEKRYFAEGRDVVTLNIRGVPVGITVCEDIWKDGPVEEAAAAGAKLILNLNASPYDIDKQARRKALLERKSRENQVGIVYVNLVGARMNWCLMVARWYLTIPAKLLAKRPSSATVCSQSSSCVSTTVSRCRNHCRRNPPWRPMSTEPL